MLGERADFRAPLFHVSDGMAVYQLRHKYREKQGAECCADLQFAKAANTSAGPVISHCSDCLYRYRYSQTNGRLCLCEADDNHENIGANIATCGLSLRLS